jgi:cation diffusion facilitator family transporter
MNTLPTPATRPPHCSHGHAFDSGNPAAERGTRLVTAGWWFNSMALLADGWHMSSHAVAIGLSALAYAMARRLAADPRFAFGTWKIEVLAGFSSALFLLGVAVLMVVGSIERLLDPQPIRYVEAMAVGVLGLVVNLASAFILGGAHHGHDHGHDHGHAHGHHEHHGHDHDGPGHHEDLNLRAAYLHVIADAATSVLAILALAGGWWLGWGWLDPVMGVVGAVLVAIWAKGLIAETGKVLLDREMDHPVVGEIREVVQEHAAGHGLRLTDLHVWRVGRGAWACALTLVTHDPALTADAVRQWLSVHEEIVHVTVELQRG